MRQGALTVNGRICIPTEKFRQRVNIPKTGGQDYGSFITAGENSNKRVRTITEGLTDCGNGITETEQF